VLIELVRPQRAIHRGDIRPVTAHVAEQVMLTVGLEDGGDIIAVDLSRRVAEGLERSYRLQESTMHFKQEGIPMRTIAFIRPQSVDGPRSRRSQRWIRIPKLRLQELPTSRLRATRRRDRSRVVAAELHQVRRGACDEGTEFVAARAHHR